MSWRRPRPGSREARTSALRTPPRSNGFSRSAAATSRPARARCRPSSAWPSALDRPLAALSGGEARARGAGRDPALALRRLPPRRADERSRLRRARARWSGSSTASPAALVVVSHDRAFLDRTVTRIVEIDPWTRTACGSARAAGASTTAPATRRATAAYAAFEQAQERRRRELRRAALATGAPRRGPGGAMADRRGTHAPDGEGAPGGAAARADGRPGEAVRAVGAAPRRSRARERPRRAVAGSRAPSAGAARSGSARSTSTSRRASGSRSRAERQRQVDAARAAAGRAAARSRAARRVGRRTVRRHARARPRRVRRRRPLARRLRRAHGARRVPRRGRSSPSSGSARTTSSAPAWTLSPGERTRAQLAELQARGVNLPRARRAHEPPRPRGDRAARDRARRLRRSGGRGLPRPPLPGADRPDARARALAAGRPPGARPGTSGTRSRPRSRAMRLKLGSVDTSAGPSSFAGRLSGSFTIGLPSASKPTTTARWPSLDATETPSIVALLPGVADHDGHACRDPGPRAALMLVNRATYALHAEPRRVSLRRRC